MHKYCHFTGELELMPQFIPRYRPYDLQGTGLIVEWNI